MTLKIDWSYLTDKECYRTTLELRGSGIYIENMPYMIRKFPSVEHARLCVLNTLILHRTPLVEAMLLDWVESEEQPSFCLYTDPRPDIPSGSQQTTMEHVRTAMEELVAVTTSGYVVCKTQGSPNIIYVAHQNLNPIYEVELDSLPTLGLARSSICELLQHL